MGGIIHHLIKIILRVTINGYLIFFMMLFLYVSTSVGHPHGGHLQRNMFITDSVKHMCVYGCRLQYYHYSIAKHV